MLGIFIILFGVLLLIIGFVAFGMFLYQMLKLKLEQNELKKDQYYRFLNDFKNEY